MEIEADFSSFQLMEWQAYFNVLHEERVEHEKSIRDNQPQPVSRVDQKQRAMGDKSPDEQRAEFDAEFAAEFEDGVLKR